MMHSRSRRRRASGHEEEARNGSAPSLIEIFLNYLTERIARSAILRFRHGAQEVVTWTLQQALAGAVTAVVLSLGIALVLVAGVKGLEAAHCPSWAAYLSAGVAAVGAALLLLRGVLARPAEDDDEEYD
jgi:hypothetical protein